MIEPELKLPYSRPQSLSDPFNDFPQDYLDSLIDTQDKNLDSYHYKCLLGPYCPAGSYKESAYFLPLAFDYIDTHEEDAFDLIFPLVGFTSMNAAHLAKDDALDAVRFKLRQCIDRWTSHFSVKHYDYKKGWRISYSDYVCNSETVRMATRELIRFESHDDIALSFIADLAASKSNPVKSAWFLEYVRAHVSNDINRQPKRKEIRELFDDEQLAIFHATNVRESLPGFNSAET